MHEESHAAGVTHGPVGGGRRADTNYLRLAAMSGLSFLSMYVLMFSMVNTARDVYHNLNTAYMAALMASPMVLIELWLMRAMYRRRAVNVVVAGVAVAVLALAFLAIRVQTGVADQQFLRSMIPHHSGAILMCREASIKDAELSALCDRIIESQQEEIDQMNAIMTRLGR